VGVLKGYLLGLLLGEKGECKEEGEEGDWVILSVGFCLGFVNSSLKNDSMGRSSCPCSKGSVYINFRHRCPGGGGGGLRRGRGFAVVFFIKWSIEPAEKKEGYPHQNSRLGVWVGQGGGGAKSQGPLKTFPKWQRGKLL